MTLEQLLARMKEIIASCQTMITEASASEAGEMDETQQAAFDALTAESVTVKANIARLETVAALEAEINGPAGRQSAPNTPRQSSGANEPDPMSGFADLGEFARSVHSACRAGGQLDPRLNMLAAPTNFMQETGGGSNEGFAVPPAMRQEIWELVFGEQLDLLGMVDSEPTAGNQVELSVDTDTPWSGSGVIAKWRSEAAQMTASKFGTDGRDVKLHELYAFVLATDELLEDAPRLASRLTRKSAEAIRWKANQGIFEGTGAGQPLGFTKSGSLVEVAKETSQVAATVVAENVAKMYSRLLPSSIQRGVWLVNSDVLPQLLVMTLGNNAIWTPPNEGFKGAPGGMLLGRPVLFTEHAETLGTKGDIQFIDPMGYYLAQKQSGVQFASSMHLFFDYNMQAFRWTFRIGGMPYLNAAVSPNKGTATKSHFVTLATRS